MEYKDYYKILQVDPTAEPEVIDAAYKRLALKYHPDTNKSSDSRHRMQEINLAYEILSDPQKRAFYDTERNLSSISASYKDTTTNQHKYPSKKNLLLYSNFSSLSDYWLEGDFPDIKAFHKDGYYHIAIFNISTQFIYPPILVSNFSIHVDIQFAKNCNIWATGGIVFRVQERDEGENDFYIFNIRNDGNYFLDVVRNGEWIFIIDWQFSPFIKLDDEINSLMVEMIDDRINLGVNGQILSSTRDKKLSSGYVGLSLRNIENLYAEARFRDYRLYSIE